MPVLGSIPIEGLTFDCVTLCSRKLNLDLTDLLQNITWHSRRDVQPCSHSRCGVVAKGSIIHYGSLTLLDDERLAHFDVFDTMAADLEIIASFEGSRYFMRLCRWSPTGVHRQLIDGQAQVQIDFAMMGVSQGQI